MPVPSQLDTQSARRPFRLSQPVRRFSLVCLLAGAGWASACNLTATDFDPVVVGLEPAAPPPPGEVAEDAGIEAEPDVCPGPECPPVECEGPECTPKPGLLNATCTDGMQNGGEAGSDCGSVCPNGCEPGSGCEVDADCESRRCEQGRCAEPSCEDETLNQDETGVDCGGDICSRVCPDGGGCGDGSDCSSGVCGPSDVCAAPSCDDEVRNGDETDEDCGGSCDEGCVAGEVCLAAADCASQVCGGFCPPGVDLCCQAPSCTDGIANGGEPVPDCGNFRCGLCPLGRPCIESNDCQAGLLCEPGSNVCVLAPTCTDTIQNGDEPSTDCGGSDPACPRCADRLPCAEATDCANNNCFENVCVSCGSTVKDGTETDIDCGGADPACNRCLNGQICLVGTDCATGQCFTGFCGG